MGYKINYKIVQYYLTKNDCYKKGVKRSKTTGILRHDTAAGNKYLSRYIDDAENLGKNKYGNHWNKSGIAKCVHFMIGLDKNDDIAIYQILPLNYRCWGCGSGKKGSYNNSHIQYEILDDGYKYKEYFDAVMKAADWLDAYLCEKYDLDSSRIICHYEAYQKGYATCHSDILTWLKKFDKTMSWCRSCVKAALNEKGDSDNKKEDSDNKKEDSSTIFKVKIITDSLNARKGPGTSYDKVSFVTSGNVFTIVEEKNGWGKLKSGVGWINVSNKYVKKL